MYTQDFLCKGEKPNPHIYCTQLSGWKAEQSEHETVSPAYDRLPAEPQRAPNKLTQTASDQHPVRFTLVWSLFSFSLLSSLLQCHPLLTPVAPSRSLRRMLSGICCPFAQIFAQNVYRKHLGYFCAVFSHPPQMKDSVLVLSHNF